MLKSLHRKHDGNWGVRNHKIQYTQTHTQNEKQTNETIRPDNR